METFVFVAEGRVARPPIGLDSFSPREFAEGPFEDVAQDQCESVLDKVSAKPSATRIHHDGVGALVECTPFCHFLERDGVWCLLAGEVSIWPGHDTIAEAHDAFMRGQNPPVESDAEWLHDFYSSFSMHANASDVTEAALQALSRVVGPFAFVVYDSVQRRVWAARDKEGGQALYWGTTNDGQLVFSTCATKIDQACNPSPAPFPAGTLYASSGNTYASSPGEEGWVIYGQQKAGTLVSFLESSAPGQHWRGIKAIPRMTSAGVVCGAVYRVASEQQLGIRGH